MRLRNPLPHICREQASLINELHEGSNIPPEPAITRVYEEVFMKIRELAKQWEQTAKGRLTKTGYAVHLDVEAAARLAALAEMYPKRSPEELLGELIGAALEELEASFPYIQGQHVVATDEEGDPLYEDVGPTPRFLALSRRYLQDLSDQQDSQQH